MMIRAILVVAAIAATTLALSKGDAHADSRPALRRHQCAGDRAADCLRPNATNCALLPNAFCSHR